MKVTLLLLLFGVYACQTVTDTRSVSDHLATEVTRIDTVSHTLNLHSKAAVTRFYAQRELALFWSSGGQLLAVADSLLATLRQASSYGLLPRDYHVEQLDILLIDSTAQDRIQRLDVLLSDAYFTFCHHLKQGRLDRETLQLRDHSRHIDPEAIASLQELSKGSLSGTLARLEPAHDHYHNLKRVLMEAVMNPDRDSVQENRILTLSLNLERWRWEKQWPDRYVVVNIPSFLLRVIEADSIWLESRVVVGKRTTPTPVMESVIKSFLIYPYWHVPHSISTKEILPDLQRDASYLQQNNFQVLNKKGDVILPDTIQWDRYSADHFPFTLRQREGSENSMGIIKFNFANRYGVYLHDTNSKRLYAQARRDFSHGCVRVEKAVSLAHYLVHEDDIYVSPEDLDQYLSLQQRLKIDLRKPIPLKLVYFTAEVRDGVPIFYEDIYKKDSVMTRALYPPTIETAFMPAF